MLAALEINAVGHTPSRVYLGLTKHPPDGSDRHRAAEFLPPLNGAHLTTLPALPAGCRLGF